MLVERDPHQIIEGIVIAGVRDPVPPRVHLPARRVRARRRAARAGGRRGVRAKGFLGTNILGSGFDLEIVVHRGAGAYIAGDETGAALEPRGRARRCRASSRRSPRSQGLYAQADGRQQRRDAVDASRTSSQMGGEGYAEHRRRTGRPGTRIFSVSGHVEAPGQLRGRARHARSATSSTASPAASAAARSSKFFIPGGASSPWLHRRAPRRAARHGLRAAASSETMLGSGRGHGVRRGRRSGAGRVAAREVLRPRVVRQVHAVPRGLGLDREGALPDGARPRPPRGPRPAARRSATTSSPGLERAVRADDDLPARPEHDVAGREPRPVLPRRDHRAHARATPRVAARSR